MITGYISTRAVALRVAFAVLLLLPIQSSAIDVIDVQMTPETPDAFDQVQIRLVSFTTDLGASEIIWTIDGKVVAEGPSQTEFSLQAGDYGELINVVATIITPKGERIVKNIPIAPVGIDLLWEAQGYTPPFYKGKARPTAFSKVKVVAYPRFHASSDDPRKYAYSWFIRNNTKVGEGLARNSVIIESPRIGQSLPIRAEVTSPDRSLRGVGKMSIKSVSPVIRLYEVTPLRGLRLESPFGESGIPTTENPALVLAVPYYFSLEDVEEGNLRVSWTIDGATSNKEGPGALEMAVPAPEKTGLRNVGVLVENRKNIFQSSDGAAPVGFIIE